MPLSVLQLGATPFPSADPADLYLRATARGLAARGHRVAIACFHGGSGRAPREVDLIRGPRVPARSPTFERALLVRTVARILDRRPVDVIHAHGPAGPWIAALARTTRRAPQIVGDFGMGPIGRVAARGCDAAVAATAEQAEALRAAGVARVAVIPAGVDPLELTGGRAERARSRWDLGDGPWILALGPAAPVAGAGMLHLGGGERSVNPADLEQLRDALAVASVALAPSAEITAAMLSCLAMGIPVVADGCALPGTVGTVAGLLADPDYRRSVGEAGREAVARDWTNAVQAARLEAFYGDLLGGRGAVGSVS
jgi:hypothetical protein